MAVSRKPKAKNYDHRHVFLVSPEMQRQIEIYVETHHVTTSKALRELVSCGLDAAQRDRDARDNFLIQTQAAATNARKQYHSQRV